MLMAESEGKTLVMSILNRSSEGTDVKRDLDREKVTQYFVRIQRLRANGCASLSPNPASRNIASSSLNV